MISRLTRGAPTAVVALASGAVVVLLAGMSIATASEAGHHAVASHGPVATQKYVRSEINKLAQRRVMWAYVEADGTIGAQSGGISLAHHGDAHLPGFYYIKFPVSLSHAALTATLHYSEASGHYDGLVSAALCGDPKPLQDRPNGSLDCDKGANNSKEAFVYVVNIGGTATQDEGFYLTATL